MVWLSKAGCWLNRQLNEVQTVPALVPLAALPSSRGLTFFGSVQMANPYSFPPLLQTLFFQTTPLEGWVYLAANPLSAATTA